MGDPRARKSAAVLRLRNSLHRKRESLADQFEFKMFVTINFNSSKDKKTKSSMFECSEVLPVMTNNYEQCIMDGAKNDTYSYKSSRELIDKDIVQFHAHSWKPLRRDIQGSKTPVDFLLWPRTDIETIECHLFSRWKDDHGPFKQIDTQFIIQSYDYEPQLKHLLTIPKHTGLLTVNPAQTTFLFVDRHYFKLEKDGGPKPVLSPGQDNLKRLVIYRLRSVCLYLPQDQLLNWGSGTAQDLVTRHFILTQKQRKKKYSRRGERERDDRMNDRLVEKGSGVCKVKEEEMTGDSLERKELSDVFKENERKEEHGLGEVVEVAA